MQLLKKGEMAEGRAQAYGKECLLKWVMRVAWRCHELNSGLDL